MTNNLFCYSSSGEKRTQRETGRHGTETVRVCQKQGGFFVSGNLSYKGNLHMNMPAQLRYHLLDKKPKCTIVSVGPAGRGERSFWWLLPLLAPTDL